MVMPLETVSRRMRNALTTSTSNGCAWMNRKEGPRMRNYKHSLMGIECKQLSGTASDHGCMVSNVRRPAHSHDFITPTLI